MPLFFIAKKYIPGASNDTSKCTAFDEMLLGDKTFLPVMSIIERMAGPEYSPLKFKLRASLITMQM